MRRLAVCMAALAFAAAGLGTGQAAEPDAKAGGETLRVHVYPAAVNSMPYVVAHAKGFCTLHGFTCTLTTLGTGSLALQALVGHSIDVAQPGIDNLVAASANNDNLLVVASSQPDNTFTLVARSDVALPHRAEGYPAVMHDLKGRKIGVPGRGSAGEIMLRILLHEAGMAVDDVTIVPVGTPASGFAALTAGKVVDAAISFQPMLLLCQHTKSCVSLLDLSAGQGPKAIQALNGAYVVAAMRRDMVEANPRLAAALVAALADAETWFKDPAHFDELVKIYEPLVGFGDLPDASALRIELIRGFIPKFDLHVRREAVRAMADLMLSLKLVDHPVDASRLVWDKAP